jgi:hypothetical protein
MASFPGGGPSAYGAGDTELGIKYRFVQETDLRPMVGVFPMLELPTGNSGNGTGNGRTWAKLPLWLQKSWGDAGDKWTTYGGGGYAFNDALGQRSYPFGGWLLQKDLSDTLTRGGELFAQGKTTDQGEAALFANVGGTYGFSENFSLLFSVGHTIAGENHLIAYIGLYWTW